MKKTLIKIVSFSIFLSAMPNFANAAVTVFRAAPVTSVRVSAPPVRVSQPVRSSFNYKNNTKVNASPIPLYVPFVAGAVASNANASDNEATVATPMLTICTYEEAKKAEEWQKDCNNIAEYSNEVSSSHCPILSYFRYCKEATPEEVKGLKPLKSHYKHVYIDYTK
jgi:hypothetical protein